jgi:hypothetical protein
MLRHALLLFVSCLLCSSCASAREGRTSDAEVSEPEAEPPVDSAPVQDPSVEIAARARRRWEAFQARCAQLQGVWVSVGGKRGEMRWSFADSGYADNGEYTGRGTLAVRDHYVDTATISTTKVRNVLRSYTFDGETITVSTGTSFRVIDLSSDGFTVVVERDGEGRAASDRPRFVRSSVSLDAALRDAQN